MLGTINFTIKGFTLTVFFGIIARITRKFAIITTSIFDNSILFILLIVNFILNRTILPRLMLRTITFSYTNSNPTLLTKIFFFMLATIVLIRVYSLLASI